MKLYFEAEEFLKPGRGLLQTRVFAKKMTSSPKHVFALVYQTLKYKPYIQAIIKSSKIKTGLKTRISDELLLLLVHDLLFSPKGRIQLGKHPIKDAILMHNTRLHAEFIKLKLKHKVKKIDELPTQDAEDETPVRWFRINTIKTTEERFFKQEPMLGLQPVSSIQEITKPGLIYKDSYIPNLYGVHPREKITKSLPYMRGELIIQDRASCFPAHILNYDHTHAEVIDACAAPGNKTTHSASYVDAMDAGNLNPVVYAFERDAKRVKILKKMCETATGKVKRDLIQITHTDFTTTIPEDFPNVTGLVVDPSCSGSGIFGRALEDSQQEQEKEEIDEERLKNLASFQYKIVKHALLFPAATKVVYLTCSIHPHENERVVIDLLNDKDIQEQGWHLEKRSNVVPDWPRRGWAQEFSSFDNPEELAGGCIRAEPRTDGGIGFFAACFVRNKDKGQ